MFETMQQNIIKNVRTKAINNLISNEENKMSEQMVTTQRNENRRHSGVVGGAILISIGLFTLIQQFVQIHWGLYFLPFLALIFLVAGIVGRRPGLLIPGGFMAFFGLALLAGQPGLQFLTAFGYFWPVILIAAGLYLILRRRDARQ